MLPLFTNYMEASNMIIAILDVDNTIYEDSKNVVKSAIKFNLLNMPILFILYNENLDLNLRQKIHVVKSDFENNTKNCKSLYKEVSDEDFSEFDYGLNLISRFI